MKRNAFALILGKLCVVGMKVDLGSQEKAVFAGRYPFLIVNPSLHGFSGWLKDGEFKIGLSAA